VDGNSGADAKFKFADLDAGCSIGASVPSIQLTIGGILGHFATRPMIQSFDPARGLIIVPVRLFGPEAI
jgi:hypothetical protein